MKEFIIDGSKFKNIREFYNEIDKVFTRNLKWKTGHNLDAFNDVLRGGFGVHNNEAIKIKWINYEQSKKNLGNEMILKIIEIILDFDNSGHDCKLELYK